MYYLLEYNSPFTSKCRIVKAFQSSFEASSYMKSLDSDLYYRIRFIPLEV